MNVRYTRADIKKWQDELNSIPYSIEKLQAEILATNQEIEGLFVEKRSPRANINPKNAKIEPNIQIEKLKVLNSERRNSIQQHKVRRQNLLSNFFLEKITESPSDLYIQILSEIKNVIESFENEKPLGQTPLEQIIIIDLQVCYKNISEKNSNSNSRTNVFAYEDLFLLCGLIESQIERLEVSENNSVLLEKLKWVSKQYPLNAEETKAAFKTLLLPVSTEADLKIERAKQFKEALSSLRNEAAVLSEDEATEELRYHATLFANSIEQNKIHPHFDIWFYINLLRSARVLIGYPSEPIPYEKFKKLANLDPLGHASNRGKIIAAITLILSGGLLITGSAVEDSRASTTCYTLGCSGIVGSVGYLLWNKKAGSHEIGKKLLTVSGGFFSSSIKEPSSPIRDLRQPLNSPSSINAV